MLEIGSHSTDFQVKYFPKICKEYSVFTEIAQEYQVLYMKTNVQGCIKKFRHWTYRLECIYLI